MVAKTKELTANQLKAQEIALEREANAMISNELSRRQTIIDKLMDPRRSIEEECGHTPIKELTTETFQTMYDREGVASRVVQVLPEESWKVQPLIYETKDEENQTPFEEAWDDLASKLQGFGEESHFTDENDEGHPLWEYLLRADIQSGIGHYGILLMGVNDGKELSEPLEPKAKPEDNGEETVPNTNAEGERELLYVTVFPQHLAPIAAFDNDRKSPRYGKPTHYNVSFYDPNAGVAEVSYEPMQSQRVHWTRVVHLADNLESSPTFGVPRQRPVFNRLYDLQKLYGGSAEMYWQGAFPGLSFETHPQLGADVKIPEAALRTLMEKYYNGLQRYIAVAGIQTKSVAPQVVDPDAQIRVQLEAICIRLAIPLRVFMGSERGELASSQDSETWDIRLKRRQRMYITPRIIIPVIDWLIRYGVLPVPPEKYKVEWPDLSTLGEAEAAQILVHQMDALSKYVSGSIDQVVTPIDLLTKFFKFSSEEAQEILDNAEEYVEERQEREEEEFAAEQQRMKEMGLEPAQFGSDFGGGGSFSQPQPKELLEDA